MTSQRKTHRHPGATSTQWRKSSYSNPNGNECVEVSFGNDTVGMRDSHHHDTVLAVNHAEWTAFLDSVTASELLITPDSHTTQTTTEPVPTTGLSRLASPGGRRDHASGE